MTGLMFQHMFATLPHFLAYFFSAIVLLVGFLAVFVRLTPHNEFALIRDGNSAAAAQLTGTVLGFAVPLAMVISHSVSISDMFAWGLVSLVMQVVTFWAIQMWYKTISARIIDNCLSSGILVGGLALAVGIIQAGCMVP